MWPALKNVNNLVQYRAATRKHTASNGKFHSLEMNSYGKGNRPVRAIVNKDIVQHILRRKLTEDTDTIIKMFGGQAFDFGTRHDKKSLHKRRRSIISLKEIDDFFRESGGVDGLEKRLLDILFIPHENTKNGVLLADGNGMLSPHYLYDRTDFRLITAMIFNDPGNSSEQNIHEDVAGCDRDPIWNIIFPIKLSQCAKMAATEFLRNGGCEMNAEQATMWDACWPHRGLGNKTLNERVFLHLLIAPYWMVIPDSSTRDFKGLCEEKQRLLRKLAKPCRGCSEEDLKWQFVTELQYGNAEHHGI